MDDYLIDKQELGKFVDSLIEQKPSLASGAEEINEIREKAIKDLDDRIGMAIFGKFTKEQNEEFNQILDDVNSGPEAIAEFFNRIGLDVKSITSETAEQFGKEFLGGNNG